MLQTSKVFVFHHFVNVACGTWIAQKNRQKLLMKKELNHPPVNFGKTGVLIINLGTPDSTSWLDIRKYLREFLSDKRVIEVNS